MDLQTGELRQFSALMLLPPGNVQAEIESWRRQLQQEGLLQLEATPPAWLYLHTLAETEFTSAINQLAARQLPPLVLDTIAVQNDRLYLESAIGWNGSGTMAASRVNLRPNESGKPLASPILFRHGSILLGRLAQDLTDSRAEKLSHTALRSASVQAAVVDFQARSLPGTMLSWRIRQAKYLKLLTK